MPGVEGSLSNLDCTACGQPSSGYHLAIGICVHCIDNDHKFEPQGIFCPSCNHEIHQKITYKPIPDPDSTLWVDGIAYDSAAAAKLAAIKLYLKEIKVTAPEEKSSLSVNPETGDPANDCMSSLDKPQNQ